jgi:flagellar L-ring protein precursor FlgH
MRNALALLVLSVVVAGCGPAHIAPYEPKKRAFDLPPSTPVDEKPSTEGSLWKDGQLAGGLFVDARAFRVNDVVVVRVEEVADAERSADTGVQRKSSASLGVNAVPIIGPLIPTGMTVDSTLGTSTETQFDGGGSTNRKERLVATVSTVVKQVLQNGNLLIEGHRVILVNNEEHHLYVSGIVRPVDIDQQNSIASSRIAEAEIEFVGRGVVTDSTEQGVFPRFLHWFWPF